MLDEIVEEHLKRLLVTRQEFSELLIRLLDYGVICRAESQVEATLYDRFLACSELVESYFSFLGVRVQHDKQFAYLRVYPPGATVPGLSDETDQPFNSGFRVRPSQQEVALILVLRAEYEKSLREGQIQDDGSTMLSLEALAIAMNNLLKRKLPEGQLERKNLFRRIRQLRLIQFNADDELDENESWLRILPSITNFVSEEVLQSLAGGELKNISDGEPEETEKVIPSELFENGEQG